MGTKIKIPCLVRTIGLMKLYFQSSISTTISFFFLKKYNNILTNKNLMFYKKLTFIFSTISLSIH